MDSLDQQVLSAARRWAGEGYRFALVTVARTWGSSPRPPGARLALREDGLVQGSVSGGCIEDDLIDRMRTGRLGGERADEKPFSLIYGVDRADALRYGLPCGGSLELVIEPAPELSLLSDLAERLKAGQLAQRRIDLASGQVRIDSGQGHAGVSWDGQTLITQHGPRWRLLIIGAGQVSRFLAPIALALDYQVSICDPRLEYSSEWDIPDAPWVPGMPDDVVLDMQPDPHTAIVALTHDPKLDDMALLEALKSPAFYIGALGSQTNNARRRERLRQHFELTEEEVQRLHGPVGLSIGSRTPPEIAVAIAAELVAVRHADKAAGAPTSTANACARA
ncbi:XdhC family protein [Quatrionicoccus australiensis]|uniref:XdhC family protein n=1 Tax=Quatrionicoccus australiensis TaxID=138118 RepID=UPI001CFAD142|nr:XdhC family protein [Quatrionicoccus australiensis]MCB4358829.1 XdhC family protein [Quatrionicoccus australiensis]